MRTELTLCEAQEQFRAHPTLPAAVAYLTEAITYFSNNRIGEAAFDAALQETCNWIAEKGYRR